MVKVREWAITVESRPEAEDFRVVVVLKGNSDDEICDFYCKLPPDLPALLAADGPDAEMLRGLPWRKAPVGLPADRIYFYAGDRKTLSTIGERLFESLFRDPEGDDHAEVLVREIAHAKEAGNFLKVTLNLSDAPELVGVPWEAAFYKKGGWFLATDVSANLVRVLRGVQVAPPAPIAGPVRVLIVIANPYPDRLLDVEGERGRITEILNSVPAAVAGTKAFEVLEPVVEATRAKLLRAITDSQPHVVHFIGHGAFDGGSGFIALQGNEPGKADLVDAAAWRLFFRNDTPWLAFLNSCQGAQADQGNLFGGTAQGLIQAGVPFVVAMQFPISDPAAILFASEFYRALAKGEPVVQAVSRGRNAIAIDDACAAELITPVVYSSGVAEVLPLVLPAPSPTVTKPSEESAAPVPAPDRWRKIALAALGVLTIAVLALAAAMMSSNYKAGTTTNTSAEMPPQDAASELSHTSTKDAGSITGRKTTSRQRSRMKVQMAPSPPTSSATQLSQPMVVKHQVAHRTVRRSPAGADHEATSTAATTGSDIPLPPPAPPLPTRPQDYAYRGDETHDVIVTASRRPEHLHHRGFLGSIGHAFSGVLGSIFGHARPARPLPPPPSPQPQPQPQPPPPAPVCNKGPFIVFFDWDDADITQEAAAILENAVSAYGNCPSLPIKLAGHADRSGPAKYNLRLSNRRNASVRASLTTHGVPDGAITSVGLGEANPRVPTADGVRDLQNRRVEITYGPELEGGSGQPDDPATAPPHGAKQPEGAIDE